MQNLYDVGSFLDAVVDQDRRMHELADAMPPGDRTADVGQVSQKTGVVENGVAELFGGLREVDPRVFEDILEIG
jgi:hypothetical protein